MNVRNKDGKTAIDCYILPEPWLPLDENGKKDVLAVRKKYAVVPTPAPRTVINPVPYEEKLRRLKEGFAAGEDIPEQRAAFLYGLRRFFNGETPLLAKKELPGCVSRQRNAANLKAELVELQRDVQTLLEAPTPRDPAAVLLEEIAKLKDLMKEEKASSLKCHQEIARLMKEKVLHDALADEYAELLRLRPVPVVREDPAADGSDRERSEAVLREVRVLLRAAAPLAIPTGMSEWIVAVRTVIEEQKAKLQEMVGRAENVAHPVRDNLLSYVRQQTEWQCAWLQKILSDLHTAFPAV